jgi:hypothetical protein
VIVLCDAADAAAIARRICGRYQTATGKPGRVRLPVNPA